MIYKSALNKIINRKSIDILAEINDIVAFALIFEKFGTRFKIIEYTQDFDPVVASFVDFFDADSQAVDVATKALVALNTEINMINFIATADLTVGKFCDGFVENDEPEEYFKTFECICVDTFELTLDANGYGTCACAEGQANVDGVCVKVYVKILTCQIESNLSIDPIISLIVNI